ncbi:hypothetical protein KGY77_10025 [Candidatus Bipolaricaulota bacterium]|nr:hypothetical protein [Candidatus Bipolaricaulota bacterium]MBS3792961.1 hypothetical protein [Candidatus Bipolaricaulota bacterium]
MIKKSSWGFSVNLVDRAENVGRARSVVLKDILDMDNALSEEPGTCSEEREYYPAIATKMLSEWQKSQFSSPNLAERRFFGCNLEAEVISQYDIGCSDIY